MYYRILAFLSIALVARRELFIRQRSLDNYSLIDFHALVEIGIVGLSVLVVLFNTNLLQTAKRIVKTSLLPLVVYLLVSVVVAPLSQNPAYSIFFAGEYLSQVVLIFCIIASSPSHEDAVKRVIILSLIATFLTIGFSFSRLGFSGELFDYKHNVGGACGAMTGVYCFVYYIGENYTPNLKKVIFTGMIGGIGAVVLTTSASSIVSTLFGIAIASLLAGRGKAPLIILFAAMSCAAVAYPDKAFELMFPGKNLAQVESLHGRTQFWDDAVILMQEKPVLGYGYAMAAKVGDLRGTNLHNSFLSLVVSSGVIGSALFLIGLGSCFKDSFKLVREKIPGAVPAFAAFAAGLLNANTLSFFGEDWRGASFVFICLWAIIGCTVYQLKFAAPAENTR